MYDDVTKCITVQELQRAKEEFMCHTTHELYDEMELWGWDAVQHNRWARALKASHRVGVRPIWYLEEEEQEDKRLSWATATRSLRRLKARITKVVRRQAGSTYGARMATGGRCSMGTLISGGRGILEDSQCYQRSGI